MLLMESVDHFPKRLHSADQIDLRHAEVHRKPCDVVSFRLGKSTFPPEYDAFFAGAVWLDLSREPFLHTGKAIKLFRRLRQNHI